MLCDQVSAAPREKVVRVSLATLRNLADAAADGDAGDGDAGGAAAAMIKCGLVKTLKLLKDKKWADPDVADDVDALHKKLLANYRELTTLERYAAEVRSGDLAWGLVHTDKFWRENARAAEADTREAREPKQRSRPSDSMYSTCHSRHSFIMAVSTLGYVPAAAAAALASPSAAMRLSDVISVANAFRVLMTSARLRSPEVRSGSLAA